MKNNFHFLGLFIVCCSLSTVCCYSQWTNRPFEHQVFVENKGQYSEHTGISEEILFWARSGGVNLYFTKTGLKYRYNEEIQETPAERAERKKQKGYRVAKMKTHALDMQWMGCSPGVLVIAEEKAAFSYSYSYDPAKTDRGVHAQAYKRITYKNIYPGIDVEYVLPDKGGIKYDVVLHPGADLSLIKMKWSGEALSLDKDGNVIIKTSMGDFVDHAPETFYAADKRFIPSGFSLKDNVVSFVVSSSSVFHVPSSIVIDPWTTNPNFTWTNAAYDVDYDFARNVYAYGGNGMNAPFELIKFDAAGAIQWVFVTNVFSSSNFFDRYGDFAVDAASQRCYIVEGMKSNGGTGARILKLDPAGNQIGLNPGSPNLRELWRIAYNSCNKQGVIGGSALNQPVTSFPWNAAVLDTTMAALNPVAMLPIREDVDLLAIDNSGNCFMGFSTDGSPNNNQLLSAPVTTLLPTNYVVANDLKIAEVQSVSYVGSSSPNGMNGIAVNGTDLYTYNGSKVVRHNKNTGTVVNTRVLTPPQYNVWSLNQITINWSGIAVDECNNIFVGSHDTIYQLDAALNKMGFILAADLVYDIKLSPQSDTIYVAGENFVSCLNTNIICNGLNINTAVSGSCATSSATVTVSGGTAPYTYQWNPGGQTGQVASGLATGTYSVTIGDAGCPPIIKTVTVNITNGALSASVSTTPAGCLASNGSATVTPTGGSSPFTYSWSPAGGNSSTASGLAPGSYSVTITDATGCSGISTATIGTAGGPTVSVTGTTNVFCFGGNNGTATVATTGGSPPYTYVWNPIAAAAPTATGLSAGNYSVTVTDAAGCAQTQVIIITAPPAITVSMTTTPANCTQSNGTATAVASGGNGPYTYLWNPSAATTVTATGLAAGSYSVMITDANGCTQAATSLVMSGGGPTATAAASATITAGSSTTLSAGGGGTYLWSNGDTGSLIVVAPSVTTVYCVTVTDTNNCIDTACVTVYIMSEPGTSCDLVATSEAFVLPGAFSPNADGQNDRWRLLYEPILLDCVTEFYVAVYSRWGELIFEGTALSFAWDGMYKERMEGTAVFAYYLRATMKDGTEIKKKGNISLLR